MTGPRRNGPKLAYVPEYKRTRTIKMMHEGFSNVDIHRALSLSLNFVSKIRQEFKAGEKVELQSQN